MGLGPAGPLLSSAILTLLAVPAARRIARSTGFIAAPRPDRFHRTPTPLLGGAACLAAIGATLLLRPALSTAGLQWVGSSVAPGGSAAPGTLGLRPHALLLLGAAGFFLLGLWDDRRSLPVVWKAIAEGAILLAILLLGRGSAFERDYPVLIVCWFAGMLALNAWNYIDHADGLFALNACGAAVILAVCASSAPGGGSIAFLLWATAGTSLGFFFWNRPRARIFLGDAGSLGIGLILVGATLWLLGRGGERAIPASIAAHTVVFADLLLVTAARCRRGTSPFVGGCEHSGHRVFARIGAGPGLTLFGAVNLLLAAAALKAGPGRPIPTSIALVAFALASSIACSRLSPPRSHP